MIDSFIDNKESVMNACSCLYFYRRVLTVMALFNMCLNLLPDNFPTHLVFMGWLTCFTIEIASFGALATLAIAAKRPELS